MLSGGHGQDNINFLNKHNLVYDINLEYNNGVRIGNVLCHKEPRKRSKNKHAWFPRNWTKEVIHNAAKHVMGLKKNQKRRNHYAYTGTYKGIKVGTYTNKGFVSTIFPWYEQKGGKKYDIR